MVSELNNQTPVLTFPVAGIYSKYTQPVQKQVIDEGQCWFNPTQNTSNVCPVYFYVDSTVVWAAFK